MWMIDMILGFLIAVYGIVSIAAKKSILFGGNQNKYTQKSIRSFGMFSGLTEIIMGISLIVRGFGRLDWTPIVISWFAGAFAWACVAVLITLYKIILVKKV